MYGLAECAARPRVPAARARRRSSTASTASARSRAARGAGCGRRCRTRCASSPAAARSPATRSASSTTPGASCPSARGARCSSAARRRRAATYRNPEATAALFDGGWLDIGDLGYIADGELYLTGRVKDMIIRGGQQPLPVRARGGGRRRSPGIRKGCVAVFGVARPSDRHRALVVVAETRATRRRGARRAARADQRARASSCSASPADEVVLAPPHSVLKTSSGKIRRAASRELYERGAARRARGAASGSSSRGSRLRPARGAARAAAAHRDRVSSTRAGRGLRLAVLGALASARCSCCRRGGGPRAARGGARASCALAGLPVAVEGSSTCRRARTGRRRRQPRELRRRRCCSSRCCPARFVFAAKEEFRPDPFIAHRCSGTRRRASSSSASTPAAASRTRAMSRGLAKAGAALGIFPEGTFSRTPGLRPFRMGAFVVAAEAGVPVVPVAFRGSRSVLRDGEWIVRRREVRMVFGAPIAPDGTNWSAAVRLARRRAGAHPAALRRARSRRRATRVAGPVAPAGSESRRNAARSHSPSRPSWRRM